MADRTHDGRLFRILNLLDEYTGECLSSLVAQRIRSQDVIVEAHSIIERWRIHHNTVKPHSSLGRKPPAPETIQLSG